MLFPRNGRRLTALTAPHGARLPETPLPRRRDPRRVLVMSLLLGCAAALGAGAASAETLVSNIGQLSGTGDAQVSTTQAQAQAFTTGSASGGYTLDSVDVKVHQFSGTTSDIAASIYSNSSGDPGSEVHALSNPASLTGGTRTFTAPSAATLDASTTYFVVITTTSSTIDLNITSSNSQDTGGATGWSIATDRKYISSGSWNTSQTTLQIRVNGSGPLAISGIALTSDPGTDATYAYYGSTLVEPDDIEATVTFGRAVDITGTPQLELDFAGTPKTANCTAATNTTTMVCSYTVAENDSAPSGIAIAADKLTLNSGTIKESGSTTINAVLTHSAVAIDPAHKVDGSRPTLVTTGNDAPQTSVDGTQVILTFSEDLGSVDLGKFSLDVDSNINQQIDATATFSGRTVTVTLASVYTIQYGQTVEMTLIAGGAGDTAGNINSSVRRQAVTNNVPQPPAAIDMVEITSDPGTDKIYAPGDDIEVTATFDQAVAVSGTPRIEIRLGGDRGRRWAEYSSGSGTTALVFSYTVVATDESATYGTAVGTPGLASDDVDLNGGTITVDATGEDASLSYAPLVSNNGHLVNWARPTLTDAVTSTDGTKVILTFSEDLEGQVVDHVTGAGTIVLAVKVDGTAVTLSGSQATISGNLLTLRLATALTSATQAVTVSYTDPTTGDDSIGIDDLAGNDADSFTDQTVTNRFRTVDTPNEIPSNWALLPDGLEIGDKFRVLFLTSTTRDATSSDIADYNAFVQARAAAGHAAIQGYSSGFRAVASTASVDARDNTRTTSSGSDFGVPIYWLGGNKIDDTYPHFYDGTWDDESNVTDESGSAYTNLGIPEFVWTGSADDGTEYNDGPGPMAGPRGLGTSVSGGAERGYINSVQNGATAPNPLYGNDQQDTSSSYPLYALSPVFVVVDNTEVPSNWALKPTGLTSGDRFRLLFLSSTTRDATSTDIADYNTFVQTAAAAGHAAIQDYSDGFRAVASTAADDARDNTYTTYTASEKGLPIYWLGGNNIADEYEDFYDGSWDDEANATDESGSARSTSADADDPWTGSDHDGTELFVNTISNALGGAANTFAAIGNLNDSTFPSNGPLSGPANSVKSGSRPLYGLSLVFVVGTQAVVSGSAPTVTGVEITSSSHNGFNINGETIRVGVTFSAAVDITGSPQLELDFDGAPKAATCTAATNTTTMVCRYTVGENDSAPNGIAIAANKLTLNGGTITATGSPTINANLDHGAVAIDADQKVDGIRPTLVTTGANAPTTSADGTKVILTFSEDIGSVTPSLITIEGNSVALPTSGDNIVGPTVELTLTTALTDSAASLTVALAVGAVLDAVGNDNLAVAATAVINAITAQTTQVLVSNIGQAETSTSSIFTYDHAQGFTTGSNSAGYTLTSIEVQITTSGSIASAVVRKTDPNTGDLVATLTGPSPGDTVGTGAQTFTAPSGTSLEPSTEYFVVFESGSATNALTFSVTGADGEDASAAAGWSISDSGHFRNRTATGNFTAFTGSKRIRVNGTINAITANASPAFSAATATRSVPENSPASTNVGALVTATDADTGDTVSYSLEGTDATSFSIVATSGQIQTKSGVTLDHEADDSYSVTVKAEDGHGGSATIAVTITVTDVAEQPETPAAPTVTATSGSTTSLDVAWTAPGRNGGPALTGYKLRYRKGSGSWTEPAGTETGTSAMIGSLDANSSYQVQVRALNGETPSAWSPSGTGSTGTSNSAPVFANTTATRSVPENTAANTNIGTALPAATDADNDPLTYTLEGAEAASFGFDPATRQLSTKSGVTYDRETQSSYPVTLKADDDNGGTDTIAVTITLTNVIEPPDRPAAPLVSPVAGSTPSLSVNWTAPSNTGPAIDNYDLQYREGSSGSWINGPQNVSGTSATIGSLTASTSYQVQVLATNAEGDSPWSLPGSGQTSALGAPNVPTGLSATPGNRQVMLGWVQPSGGAEVTHYEYEQDGSGTWISTGGTATSHTVMGLDNGTAYTFRVRAVNSAGASPPSAASASVTPAATAPEAPQSLGATPGNQQVTLRWTAPASDGGEPITRYEYEQDLSGTWTSTGSAETSHTVRALDNGTAYTFRVRAVNSVGAGAASGSLSVTPETTEPDAPQSLEVTPGDGQVTLRWEAPDSDGGEIISHYEYEQDFSGTWISTGSAETSHTVTGLANGQTYTFRVRAVNSRGYGEVVTIEATPSPPSPPPPPPPPPPGGGGGGGGRLFPPEAPGNLVAAVGGSGSVVLSWEAPDDGGTEITDYEYRIEGDGEGEGEWISIGSTETTYTVTGLADGQTYTFQVRAVNLVRESGASDRAEVTLAVFEVLDFAHFANGTGITSELVLVSVATHPIRPALYFYDQGGLLIDPASVVDVTVDLVVAEDGSLTVRTTMEPLVQLTISTHGRGELVSGSVQVVSDGPIGGGVRYSVPGVGVTGVGASPPVRDVVFPARRQEGGIRTAASLHNLGEEAVGVGCRLMSGGVVLEEVEILLEANGQASWFIEEAFTATDTSDFLGSVRCSAGGGLFTAIAIETNGAKGIYTTLPVMEVDPTGGSGGETVLDFAHLANGGWTTDLVLVNLSTQPSRPALGAFDSAIPPSRPVIYFHDTEGNPIDPTSVVDLTSGLEVTEDGALTVSAAMEPLAVVTIPTHGRGELVTGSVRVVSEGPVGGMLRFGHSAFGAAGVEAGLPLSEAIFPVWRQQGGITTGVALHNLEPDPGQVYCELMRAGVVLDTMSLPLATNGQTSWLIDQAFPSTDTSDFAGLVRCSAGGGLFTALALEMDSATRTFAALPVVPVEETRYLERRVVENSPAGTDVGTPVAATDPDSTDTLTYSLGGPDAASFAIVSASGQIRTGSGVSYDHETRSRYVVEVSVSDGTATASVVVVIRVTDVDEQPETPAAPEVAATPATTDSLEVGWTAPGRGGGPELTGYKLRYRKGGGSWTELEGTVTGTSATITPLDAGSSYQVQVQAQNGETPSGWSPSGTGMTGRTHLERSVAENSPAGTNVGAPVGATDPDSTDTLEYSLGGPDAESFAIVSASGQIRTRAGVSYDHETRSSYVVEVSVTDGTATATIEVVIRVTDVDEQPETPAAPEVAATPDTTDSLEVGWTAPGRGGGPELTGYKLRYRKGAGGSWTERAGTAAETSATIRPLDAGSSYQVQVQAQNGETPSGWSPSGTGMTGRTHLERSVAENSPAGTDVGAPVGARDPGSTDTLTYSLGGPDAASFAIVSASGQIRTREGVSYDHETKSLYVVEVSVTDGTATASIVVVITVTDVDEQPETPAAPEVGATPDTTDSLNVSWTAPGRGGGPALTGYKLRYRKGTGGSWTERAGTGTETSATIRPLEAGSSYQVQVQAQNGETPSAWSPSGTGSTGNTPPVFEP